ncbi:MAG: 4a-hydroxytetrahydrobiopterin dehydratase [Pseudomonadota bacterium]|nr:4a-hydroxytetrahydrobiopterin dehydratase [Pseudomonadota bacterium]
MTELKAEKCEVCRVGAPRVEAPVARQMLEEIPGWELLEDDGVLQLCRRYAFADFAAALRFTNRVGALAEDEGHHPALLTEWGAVTVRWWTHKIDGLHRNDFVMAAKTDAVASAD